MIALPRQEVKPALGCTEPAGAVCGNSSYGPEVLKDLDGEAVGKARGISDRLVPWACAIQTK